MDNPSNFLHLCIIDRIIGINGNKPKQSGSLCFVFSTHFFTSAVLWILAEAEFLALILILVYVGAVMTLFLFVVMMLNIDIESMKSHLIKYLPFGLIIVALLTGLLMVAIPKDLFKNSVQIQEKPMSVNSQLMDLSTQDELVPPENVTSNTEKLGMVLYTDYFLAFEIAAVILLVAIVSAITLVHRGAVRSKRQDITQQIMTRRAERVKLISMKPEK